MWHSYLKVTITPFRENHVKILLTFLYRYDKMYLKGCYSQSDTIKGMLHHAE